MGNMTATNAGFAAAADLFKSNVTYIALGSDSTAAAATQTALLSEYSSVGLSRASATMSRSTYNVANDTTEWEHSFTYTGASGANNVKEMGIFDAASGGNMYAREVITTISPSNGDTIVITVECVHAAA